MTRAVKFLPWLCLFVLLVHGAGGPVSAGDFNPGDRVVVVQPAELRVSSRVVGRVPAGIVLQVQRVHGGWLWVTHGKPGWLAEQCVTPLAAHIAALNDRSVSALERNDRGQARQLIQQILALDAGNVRALLTYGRMQSAEGEYQQAISIFERALRADAANPAVYYWRGDAWLRLGEFDRAGEDFTACIRRSPQHREAFSQRARARAGAGDTDGAIADLTVAIRLSAEAAARCDAYDQRGEVWLQRGDQLAAAADFAMAARHSRRPAEHWMKAARILAAREHGSTRDGETAGRYVLSAGKTTPQPPAEWMAVLAAALAASGRYDFAVQMQEKALRGADADDRTQYREMLKQYEAARTAGSRLAR